MTCGKDFSHCRVVQKFVAADEDTHDRALLILPYLVLEPLHFSLTDGRINDHHRVPGRLPFSSDSCPKAVSNMAFELVK
jgi:hypothetical protein